MGKLICMRERERKKTEAEQQKMPLIENPIKILIEVNSVKMWLIQCIQLFTPKWWYAVIDFKIASKMGEFMGKHYQIKNESEDKQKAAPFSPPKNIKQIGNRPNAMRIFDDEQLWYNYRHIWKL